MSTATVRIWRDTGYTEGSVEVPPVGSTLTSATFTYTNINVSVDSLFRTLKLKAPFEDLYDCSYLRLDLDMNNGDDITIYGWIDDVVPLSDTAGYPNTQITWHVDLWRTYISKANIVDGVVIRRTADGTPQPPQIFPYRYRYPVSRTPLIRNDNVWWIIFKVVLKQSLSAKQFTTTTFGAFPVDVTPGNSTVFKVSGRGVADDSTHEVSCVPFSYFAGGLFEEFLKLDPDSIISVFMSPIDPFRCARNGNTFYKDGLTVYHGEGIPGIETGFLCCTSDVAFHEYTSTMASGFETTDTTTAVITGFGGEVIGEIPWGTWGTDYRYRIVMDSNSAYLSIRIPPGHDEGTVTEGSLMPIMGTQFDIPLLPLEITTNAVGSYNWSGQRDADRSRMWSSVLSGGLTSIGSIASAYQQGYSTTMIGRSEYFDLLSREDDARKQLAWDMRVNRRLAPEVVNGSILNMQAITAEKASMTGAARLVGGMAATTSGIGVAASLGGAALGSVLQDAANNRARAAQTPGLAMTGTGFDPLHYGQLPTLVTMGVDRYSERQFNIDMNLNGVEVSEPFSGFYDLPGTGPIRMANVTITGSIPTSAKTYIKQRLEAGVRIV